MEMSKPVPNFVHIQGHRAMVDYRGLRRVCSRCGLEGHIGPIVQDHTLRPMRRFWACDGRLHGALQEVRPRPRDHGHATTDCIRPQTPPPPPVVTNSDASSNAGVSDSQASDVQSNAAAIPGC
ncbi:hypothetical protein HPB47_003428 [Ixodes persulcatus]|uniref:Uncharacterized protein n=1 Tax=Ixodes persulcatus TaxID=34615 RepID=A0AC60PJI1_IXOPE|nr:hypothetical protein HPB47_003428 [Ixodes persulcatus]